MFEKSRKSSSGDQYLDHDKLQNPNYKKMNKTDVAIIMGSENDLEVMQDACKILDEFDVSYQTTIVSAHRTPDRLYEFAKEAKKNGIKVIIAGAGGAAHLPGMTAAITNIPVIGVPIKTKTMDGLDSFLSIAQMPPGVPVATVAINGAKNGAILALQILAISSPMLYKQLEDWRKSLHDTVIAQSAKLETEGVSPYISALQNAK